MKTENKHRVGIIGPGGMGKHHVNGYLKTGRFEVTALADYHESAMREIDVEFNITPKHYTDAREMLDMENLDVVSVCTWHSGHAEMTIAAAARKPKVILCEKPIADTLGNAQEMLLACRRNDVKLIVGHQRRFLPSYNMARDLIVQDAIGDVQMITALTKGGMPNTGSHETDMMRYILSDDNCVWVMGNFERKTDRYERNTRIEDSASAVLEFASGARGLILADLDPNAHHGGMICGSKGMIDLTVTSLRLLNESTGGKWETYAPRGKYYNADEPMFDFVECSPAQADELADWIEGKTTTHRGEAQNGYKSMEIVHAIYESARLHEKVILPMKTLLNPLDIMVETGHLTPQRPGRYDIRAISLRGELTESDSPENGNRSYF
ncbi:MAG: Myo-inositol 2-dehydrogenase [Candidatus Moanabacter tarae]|uniref:Myo-inositol 2-dehydrogenase n=1 Tax=Candidatus Moanibacter tarae TaxID=2200854 RepID=A0A2Z4AHP9_9BACT|nr:MAG: Myo-inositol 2-dehydrogenase [Candidatus Moanabacter tarae]|tara:strand:+ start:1477 stop:2619 length:1143 start_codon:yes stop_codon:yes gene_type:complete